MKTASIIVMSLLCAGLVSQTPEPDESIPFTSAYIHHAEVMELIAKGKSPRMLYMEGDVDLELIAENEADNVRIKTPRIDFVYDKELPDTLTRLTLAGRATIIAQDKTISADKAIIDLVNETADFEGNVEIFFGSGEPLRAKSIQYHFSDGTIFVRVPGGGVPLGDL